MEISNRIKELFGLHPDLIESEKPEVPSVALVADDNSWTLITYPGTDLSAEDREWIWGEMAKQATLVLSQELPELNFRIITPTEFPDGTPVDGMIQYSFPPPDLSFVQRYWYSRMTELLPAISHLLARRIEERWTSRVPSSRPADRIARQRAEMAKRKRVELKRKGLGR